MTKEPIIKCPDCRGEGVRPTRAADFRAGVDAFDATMQVTIWNESARAIASVRVWGDECLDACRRLSAVVAEGATITLHPHDHRLPWRAWSYVVARSERARSAA